MKMIANFDQARNTGTHPTNQGAVKPSTFVGTAVLVVALLGLTAGWRGHKPSLVVQGEVEAAKIKVVPLVAGKVQTWHVRQGDKVRKGQLLVSLENQDLQTKLGQHRAATGSTMEPRGPFRAACIEAICVQSNWWAKVKAVAESAQPIMDHARELQVAGVISLQELQARERDLDLARSSERAARANFDLAVAICGEVERLAAAAEQEHATQTTAGLEALVRDLMLTSPVDGEVQRQIVEQGEWVSPGSPVASVVDLQDLWVRFDIPDNLLANIQMGTAFRVRVPCLGNQEVPVKVDYIAPNGGFAPLGQAKTTGHFAPKTFEVRAVPVRSTAGLRPGMSVLADWGSLTELLGGPRS
jgi:HlyD family secretion protein